MKKVEYTFLTEKEDELFGISYTSYLVEVGEKVVIDAEAVVVTKVGPVVTKKLWDGESYESFERKVYSEGWEEIQRLESEGWVYDFNNLSTGSRMVKHSPCFFSKDVATRIVPYVEETVKEQRKKLEEVKVRKVTIKNADGAVLAEGWVRDK